MASRSVALTLAFATGSFVTWLNTGYLLQVVQAPLAHSWFESSCSKPVPVFSAPPPDFVDTFAYLALTAGALFALPFGAQLLAARSRLRPRIEHRIASLGFFVVAYLAQFLGLALAARFGAPALVRHVVGPKGWCGDGFELDTTSTIEAYVALACLLASLTALAIQLGLVAAWFRRRTARR